MTALPENVDLSSCACGEARDTPHGRFVSIRDAEGKSPTFLLGTVRVPFGVESWKDGPSKKLDVTDASEAAEDLVRRIDEWTLAQVRAHCAEWYGRALSDEQLRLFHSPLLKRSDRFAPLIRTKVRGDGEKATLYWSDAGAPLDELDLKGGHVTLVVELSMIWVQSKGFGTVLHARHVRVEPRAPAKLTCPF